MHLRRIIWTKQQSTSGLKEKRCNGECLQNKEISEHKKSTKNLQYSQTKFSMIRDEFDTLKWIKFKSVDKIFRL